MRKGKINIGHYKRYIQGSQQRHRSAMSVSASQILASQPHSSQTDQPCMSEIIPSSTEECPQLVHREALDPPAKRGRQMSSAHEISKSGLDEIEIAPVQPNQSTVESPTGKYYQELRDIVQEALKGGNKELTTSDKVALALEVLRARQLELDLAQARENIESLVTKDGQAPKILRSVLPASAIKGLPVGTPVDITKGRLLLESTPNDPEAYFMTLELLGYGSVDAKNQRDSGKNHGIVGTQAGTTHESQQ